MASSSVHFKKATSHSSAHNTRADIPKYLLPEEHRLENEYWQNEKSARQLFDDELQKATRKGGPKPKFENSHWEAVLNLNAEHSLADVQKVVKLIEKKFNITCTSIAIHRDEGHIKDGQPIYNYHAHLEFMTYQNGQQNWRREHVKNGLSELQTIVANELKMTRGKSGAVRLEHREYKAKEQEKELVLEKEREKSAYNFRDFQQQITALSTENTDLKKELHRLNTSVNTSVNKGEADVKSLEERLTKARELSDSWKSLYESVKARPPKEVIVEKIVKVEDTTKIEELKKEISDLHQEKISSFQNEALKALEAKKEPEPIKDTAKEEKIDSRPVLSKIEQYNKQISELWDNKPPKLYDIEQRIDKRWTLRDCVHWFWAQGEAKQAREERFQAQRDILNKPYDDWERTLKRTEEARKKAIADDEHKRWQEEQKILKEKKAKEEQAKPLNTCLSNDIQDFNSHYDSHCTCEEQGMSR
jgi:hypothetical protein